MDDTLAVILSISTIIITIAVVYGIYKLILFLKIAEESLHDIEKEVIIGLRDATGITGGISSASGLISKTLEKKSKAKESEFLSESEEETQETLKKKGKVIKYRDALKTGIKASVDTFKSSKADLVKEDQPQVNHN